MSIPFATFTNMSKIIMGKSIHGSLIILIAFFAVITIGVIFFPLIVSIDSIYGFLAYKGTIQTGRFNSLQEVSQDDIAIIKNHFVAWWAPGQWIAPGIISFFLGLKLGVASIIVTVLCSVLGLIGFYKLFRYFEFSTPVTIGSLLIIGLNDIFYIQFVIYQGGEVLSFGIFPWFLLFASKMNRIGWHNLLILLTLFLACFVAKTTLIVYCSVVVWYKILESMVKKNNIKKYENISHKYTAVWLGALWLLGCILIELFYLQKGPRIVFINRFIPELSDILIPFSSPLSSILSGQTAILRIQKIVSGNAELISLIFYFALGIGTLIIFYKAWKAQEISRKYLTLFAVLYICVVLFFIAGYLFNANIDKNVRHFKLLGCLFAPLVISLVKQKKILQVCIIALAVYSVCDFGYIKNKWSKGRYITHNYFYRNYYNPDDVDRIDQKTYEKIITLDQSTALQLQRRPIIFFLESNPDLAMDLRHPSVFETADVKLGSVQYKGTGAVAFIVVSKKSFYSNPTLPQRLLPDYTKFKKIDETDSCIFFRTE